MHHALVHDDAAAAPDAEGFRPELEDYDPRIRATGNRKKKLLAIWHACLPHSIDRRVSVMHVYRTQLIDVYLSCMSAALD
jgi:hypothetical protein